MASGHDHDHGQEKEGKVWTFTAKKPREVRQHQSDASYSVRGMTEGHFAVASSKKHLTQLMNSEADMVYDQKKGNLYLNNNGELNGWGKKKIGGLVARFKGKPELEAEHFEGMKLFDSDELTSHTDGDGDDGLSSCYRVGASLSGANLLGAGLTNADLTNADLSRAMLGNATLKNVTLYGANLDGANLFGADLTEANLSYASLTDANLDAVSLYGANLTDADLTDAMWNNTTCPDGSNSDNNPSCGF